MSDSNHSGAHDLRTHLPDCGCSTPRRSADLPLSFPLSPAQLRMWHADQANPGNSAYNCAFRWKLEGPLDIAVLEQALNEIVRRHGTLRTTFARLEGTALQVVAPTKRLELQVVDLRSLPEADRESQMDRLCAMEAKQRFNLSEGPLIRAGLIRMHDEAFVLTLTLHHIISDGWSIRVIMQELRKLYGTFASGHKDLPPDLPLQYSDYVERLRMQANEASAMEQLAHWTTALQGYRRLEIQGDLPTPTARTNECAILSRQLPRELTNALSAFSNDQGVTMFITTLAACKAVLHRYSRQTDIAIGSALAGRSSVDTEPLIGLFMNHVVFRTDLSGDPPFPKLLERVQDTAWQIFANQDVPFENVVSRLEATDAPCPIPFSVINFNCYRAYGGSSDFVLDPGVRVSPMPSKSQGALYDLNLFMVERETGWRVSLEYSTDIYSETWAKQFLDDFCAFLETIAVDPNRPPSQFPLSGLPSPSTAPTIEALGGELAAGDRLPAHEPEEELYSLPASPVQERFWLLAKLDSNSSAFHMRATVRLTGMLSYRILERSFQCVVDRHESLRTTFSEVAGCLHQIVASKMQFTVALTDLQPAPDDEDALQDLLRQEARHPFNLAAGPLMRARLFRLAPEDHVLIITVHHIVADGWSQNILQRELWTAYESFKDDQEPALAPLSIQYADFSAWQRDWLESDDAADHVAYWSKQLSGPLPVTNFPTDHPSNRNSSAAGGWDSLQFSSELIQALKRLSSDHQITTFMATLAAFAVLLYKYSGQRDLFIASPVANRRAETEPLIGPFAGPILLRLDMEGTPSVADVLKRVWTVSMSAFDHADLPLECILKSLPVRPVSGRIPLFQFYFMHQTAFLQARHLSTLDISPMPSFSIGTPFELHLSIIERDGTVRVTLEYNANLFDPHTIRQVLLYYETVLWAFAKDPSGLVDEIPAPVRTTRPDSVVSEGGLTIAASERRKYVAPRNDVERLLTQTWARLLKLDEVGIHDDFFDLGGHSLLAAQLASTIEREFRVSVDLSVLLVAPTVEKLAHWLRFSSAHENDTRLVPLRAAGLRPPLFCVHTASGHLLEYRDMVTVLSADQPVYGIRGPDLERQPEPLTVEGLASEYLGMVRRFQRTGPYQLCGLSFGGLVAYEMARQLAAAGEEVGLVALIDTGNPAYYRNLSPEKLTHFRRTYLVDRLRKYGRNLARGDLRAFGSDTAQLIRSRARGVIWKLSSVAALIGRPAPAFAINNISVFADVRQRYAPEPFAGRLRLFRAEGRTAEYGDDMTLGWDGLARDGVEVHGVPGTHTSIMAIPNVLQLVEQFEPCLAKTPRALD